MNSKDLQERFKKFALRLVPLCEALPRKKFPGLLKINCFALVFPQQPTTGQPVTLNQKRHLAQN